MSADTPTNEELLVRTIPSPDRQWIRSVVVCATGKLAVGSRDIYLLDRDAKLFMKIRWETDQAVLAFLPTPNSWTR